jgi:hypothetical protein
MRRPRPWSARPVLAGGLVALALCARAPDADAADDDRQRTFKDQNFQLTLPTAEWKFEDVMEENKADGWVAIVRRTVGRGVEASAWIRVVDARGAEIDPLMAQVKEAKSQGLKDVIKNEVDQTSWAGVHAHVLTIKGRHENGSVLLYLSYGAVVDGKFHQLDIRAVNGAEDAIPKEIEALADGYRFLKGGTPPRGEGDAPSAGTEEPGADEPAMGDDAAPPPRVPTDERTKRFEGLRLTWKLPPVPGEADKPRWVWAPSGNPNLARGGQGKVAGAGLVMPDGSVPVEVELFIQGVQPGALPELFAANAKNADRYNESFEGSPIPKVDEETQVGNLEGAALSLRGKGRGDPPRPLEVRNYFAIQKRTLFMVEVVFRNGAEKTHRAEFRAAFDGLAWDETGAGVRGPLASPIPADTEPRGEYVGAEREIKITKAHGFTLTKPPAFAFLKIEGQDPATQYAGRQALWFAAEIRKGAQYGFVSISSYPTKSFMDQRPPKDPEALVDEIESEWRTAFPEAVTRPKPDKNRTKATYRNAAGSEYEFRGTLRGVPYLERGWMVKSGQRWYLVRNQYGGKDAEAAFAADVAALTKSIKFE